MEKKQVFSWNYASAHAECNFDNPAKKPTKIQKSAQPLKLVIQTTSFLKLYIFLGKLFRSHRLHVWQLCQKNRRKSEKLSAQKIEKYIITEVFFFWTRIIQNWHYYLEFVPKLTNFFLKICLSPKNSSAGIDSIFDRSLEKSRVNFDKFPAQGPKKSR